jgi:hypothetical protein
MTVHLRRRVPSLPRVARSHDGKRRDVEARLTGELDGASVSFP